METSELDMDTLAVMFSRYCKRHSDNGTCGYDDCSICPVNEAWNVIFKDWSPSV